MSDPADYTPAPEVPRYYVNQVQRHVGGIDLTLDFGFLLAGNDEPDWLVGVTMTWEEAKFVHTFLGESLALFEQHAGAIRDLTGSGPVADDIGMSQNGGARPDDEEEDELPEPGA